MSTAMLVHSTPNSSHWAFHYAGRAYRITTYPGSDLMYIKNHNGRKVQGASIEAAARAAIRRASW